MSWLQAPTARLFEPRSGPLFDSLDDELNYKHFVHIGAAFLSRYQLSALPFWTQLVPQLGETNDAVRHGLLALGSIQAPLHRATSRDLPQDKGPEWSLVALQHASKAMNLLRAADPDTIPIEIIVTCCILFLAVEIWTEKKTHSALHILAAHNILNGKRAALPQSSEVVTVYKPMVDELIIQACTFRDDFPPPNSQLSPYYKLDHGLEKVDSIWYWKDALNVVNQILRCVLRVTSRPVSCPLRGSVKSALDPFSDVLAELHTSHAPATEGSMAGEEYCHLCFHHRVAYIMLRTLGQEDESSCDDFLEDFGVVLECCETMMKQRVSNAAAKSPNLLSPKLELLPPLFFVAVKCRDTFTSQNALDLLHDTSVSERQWTSCMATALARFVVDQEADGLSALAKGDSTIKATKRIRLLHTHFTDTVHKVEMEYAVFVDGQVQEVCTATLPYKSHPSVEIDGVTATMSRKVVRACGYSSLILFTPPVDCHCVEGSQSKLSPTDDGFVLKDIVTLRQSTNISSQKKYVLRTPREK